jgi:L-malate glycosyltransferase
MTRLSIVQLFTHSAVTRGGAVQGLLLARALRERGHRVICLFHAPFGHEKKSTADPSRHPSARGLDIRWINMRHPFSYPCFRRWVQRERIDVLHTHRSLALLFAYFSTLGLDYPVMVANRSAVSAMTNPLVRHVFRSRRLGHLIAVAQAVKQDLINKERIFPDKISVIYGSFDEERFSTGRDGQAMRAALRMAHSAPLVVCIAAVERRKGLDVLLQAARAVIRHLPSAKFLVLGNIDDIGYYQALQAEVKRLDLQERFLFLGHREDVPEILAAADVAVSASREEGLSGALREALAMQKPVVCTAVGGNTELIRDGESGWVVEPGNAQALSRALLEALEDRAEASRRAENGRLMMQSYSNEVRCQRVEAIYFTLCEARNT